MRLPERAIVEFDTHDDMFTLAKLCDEIGEPLFADRLRTRKFNASLCVRIADHKFISFGSHGLYEDPFWANFVSTVAPELMYCTVQELQEYMGCELENEEDIAPIDLSEIL